MCSPLTGEALAGPAAIPHCVAEPSSCWVAITCLSISHHHPVLQPSHQYFPLKSWTNRSRLTPIFLFTFSLLTWLYLQSSPAAAFLQEQRWARLTTVPHRAAVVSPLALKLSFVQWFTPAPSSVSVPPTCVFRVIFKDSSKWRAFTLKLFQWLM